MTEEAHVNAADGHYLRRNSAIDASRNASPRTSPSCLNCCASPKVMAAF